VYTQIATKMFTIKEDSFETSQDFLRKIQSVYSLIILPPMALSTFLFIVQVQKNIQGLGLSDWYLYAMLLMVSVSMYYSYSCLWKGLSSIRVKKESKLRTKLVTYYSVIGKQLLIIAIVTWVIGVAYAVTFEPFFFYIFIFVVLGASMEWPTKFRIVRHLQVTKEEKDVLIKHYVIK
jgi:hypothetical protein